MLAHLKIPQFSAPELVASLESAPYGDSCPCVSLIVHSSLDYYISTRLVQISKTQQTMLA